MSDVAHTGDDNMRALSQISDVFNAARDAFINASKLAEEVRGLRTEVDSIKTELTETKSRNMDLDNALANTRSQRDEAYAQVNDWRSRHQALSTEHSTLQDQHNILQGAKNELEVQLDAVKRERDEAWGETRRLQEEIDAAHKQIEAFKAKSAEMQRLFVQAEAIPQVESSVQQATVVEGKPLPRPDGTLQPRDPENGQFRPYQHKDGTWHDEPEERPQPRSTGAFGW